jgi:hypothetical protein
VTGATRGSAGAAGVISCSTSSIAGTEPMRDGRMTIGSAALGSGIDSLGSAGMCDAIGES